MLRTTAVLVAALALLAPAALAQQAPKTPPQPKVSEQQQAMAPAPAISVHGFIYDEFGNVYDRDGQIIKPKPLKQ